MRSFRSIFWLLVALGPAPRGAGGEGPDEEAWSVHAEDVRADPRLPRLLAELEEARLESLAAIERRLGIAPGPLPIEWRLGARPLEAAGHGFQAGETLVERARVVVTLPAWRYLARPGQARPVVAHEAAHAVLASRLGDPARYAALPRWFREGLALHVAGEVGARVEGRIVLTVLEGRPAPSFLRGVASGPSGAPPLPAECGLAVEWLAGRLGEIGLRSLAGSLSRGEDLERLLAELAGLDRPSFAGAALESSRERVRALLGEREERLFAGAVSLYRSARWSDARDAFELLRVSGTAAVLETTCRYFEARILLESGDTGRAEDRLEALLRPDAEGLWEPEVLECLGRARQAAGRAAAARSLWREVLERYPDDRAVARRAREMLRAGGPSWNGAARALESRVPPSTR